LITQQRNEGIADKQRQGAHAVARQGNVSRALNAIAVAVAAADEKWAIE
jgi:hypothetical protein